MYNPTSDDAENRITLLNIYDRNERARAIINYGLMHEPDLADVVAVAAAGPGEHSMQLSAITGHADEAVDRPDLSKPVAPPLAAEAYRSRPMSHEEQPATNPFFRGKP